MWMEGIYLCRVVPIAMWAKISHKNIILHLNTLKKIQNFGSSSFVIHMTFNLISPFLASWTFKIDFILFISQHIIMVKLPT
jgi:hypothetical protein